VAVTRVRARRAGGGRPSRTLARATPHLGGTERMFSNGENQQSMRRRCHRVHHETPTEITPTLSWSGRVEGHMRRLLTHPSQRNGESLVVLQGADESTFERLSVIIAKHLKAEKISQKVHFISDVFAAAGGDAQPSASLRESAARSSIEGYASLACLAFNVRALVALRTCQATRWRLADAWLCDDSEVARRVQALFARSAPPGGAVEEVGAPAT
jgi:hypothetical protein